MIPVRNPHETTPVVRRQGRPPATSHEELERVALGMFLESGYDNVSVDDIAVAVGIGRRTFFCYFHSKADLVWGDYDWACEQLRSTFADIPQDVPLMDALRRGVIDFNTVDPEQMEHHRQRMRLLLKEPSLVANAMARYQQWRDVVEEFVATRLGMPQESLIPRTIAYSALGCALAAYEQWLEDEHTDHLELLDGAFRAVATQFVFVADTQLGL
jgi:TetR/AcrR family transcriptional regulator, regulator of mycofactocin system